MLYLVSPDSAPGIFVRTPMLLRHLVVASAQVSEGLEHRLLQLSVSPAKAIVSILTRDSSIRAIEGLIAPSMNHSKSAQCSSRRHL
jgi:hypothetical protein